MKIKMKTKLIAVLLCVFSVAAALTLGGCDWLFKPPKQTVKHVISFCKNTWGVYIPENITMISYYLDSFINDFEELFVVEYTDNEEEFTQQLSSEKNKDIENFFIQKCRERKNDFTVEYTLPKIPEEYFWLYMESGDDFIKDRKLYVLYMPNENQILVYNLKI